MRNFLKKTVSVLLVLTIIGSYCIIPVFAALVTSPPHIGYTYFSSVSAGETIYEAIDDGMQNPMTVKKHYMNGTWYITVTTGVSNLIVRVNNVTLNISAYECKTQSRPAQPGGIPYWTHEITIPNIENHISNPSAKFQQLTIRTTVGNMQYDNTLFIT
jgi:hypothetical protein